MINGLDLLNTRSLKENVEFLSLEEKFNIEIPPIFKLFIKSFKWRTELIRENDFFYYPDLAIGEVFFPFESLEANLISTIGSDDEEVIKKKMILFATSRFGVYIGTIGEDLDKVFTKSSSLEGDFKLIANNIFIFLQGITNNLSDVADTEEEYRKFLIVLGYQNDEIEDEIFDWKKYKGI